MPDLIRHPVAFGPGLQILAGLCKNSAQSSLHEQGHKCSTKVAGCRIKSGMTIGLDDFHPKCRLSFFEVPKNH
jgi:hypothetical protein